MHNVRRYEHIRACPYMHVSPWQPNYTSRETDLAESEFGCGLGVKDTECTPPRRWWSALKWICNSTSACHGANQFSSPSRQELERWMRTDDFLGCVGCSLLRSYIARVCNGDLSLHLIGSIWLWVGTRGGLCIWLQDAWPLDFCEWCRWGEKSV